MRYNWWRWCAIQILQTLKILPIGNKTVLRDSRILSVVEKWSSEIVASNEPLIEVATESAESADVAGDVEQEQEQDGSGTETREGNGGSELTDADGGKLLEGVSQDDAEIHLSSVSNHKTRCYSLRHSLES